MSGSAIEPWDLLRTLLDSPDALSEALDSLGSGEVARALAHMSHEDQQRLLHAVGPELAADVLEQLSRAQAVEIIEQLEPAAAAAILAELPLQAEADILRDLDDAAEVLARLPADEAEELREISRWDDDVAGGLMEVEFLAVEGSTTVEGLVARLRSEAKEFREYEVQYVYVVDDQGHLEGVLPLRAVLLAPAGSLTRDLMIPHPLLVEANVQLEDLVEVFDAIRYFALPVVDNGELVGVLRRAVVMEAQGEELAQEQLRAAGIVGGDELRSMGLGTRAFGRLRWLTLNIGLNVVAASVVAYYQDTLQSVVALAIFLPIISDMSGCSGNQAVAVSMRELSLGVATPRDILYVWGKELAVGLVNGGTLGLLLGVLGALWVGNPWLGLVAGGALALNTLVAVSIGGTVPLLAKRFGFDPALASGPLLTTITDVCGFALVLGMATMLLPRLT